MQYPGTMTPPYSCLSSISEFTSETSGWRPQYAVERQWIERAQDGDVEAFNTLIMIYQDLVYRQALWILGEEEAAEDATQETFLKAYRRIDTFLPGKSFRSWLLRIATNQCLDMLRRAKCHPSQSLEPTGPDGEAIEPYWIRDPGDSPEKVLERVETGESIWRSIQKLPSEYRAPVILVDLQGMDYVEASAVLNLSIGTFKSRLSRARHKLREDLLNEKDQPIKEKYL